jgi:hypothetical protein
MRKTQLKIQKIKKNSKNKKKFLKNKTIGFLQNQKNNQIKKNNIQNNNNSLTKRHTLRRIGRLMKATDLII